MSQTIHAVLIGINGYTHKPLAGCINDVLDIKTFFEELAAVNENLQFKPHFYLSPDKEVGLDEEFLASAKITTADYQAPTRDNILNAFDHFTEAKAGDICLFYYSGHGSFQNAPQEFWHMKSAAQVETLLAVDSRTKNGRDIIDKELGYQIHKLTEAKKDIHFLAIMDCCHAGDNTRGEEGITARESKPNRNQTPLSDYFGFAEGQAGFYKKNNLNQINPPFGAHIQMAASRQHESAKELMLGDKQRGVFTYYLLKVLRNGGTAFSYKDLVERVNVLVENRVEQQTPQISFYPADKANKYVSFLNAAKLKEVRKKYPIYYKEGKQKWMLGVGQVQGLSKGEELIQVFNEKNEKFGTAQIVKIHSTNSELVLKPINPLQDTDTNDLMLKASVDHLLNPSISVYVDIEDKMEKAAILKAAKNYSLIHIEETRAEAEYILKGLETSFILTKRGGEIPLFKRQPNSASILAQDSKRLLARKDSPEELAKSFAAMLAKDSARMLSDVNSVARWLTLLERENTNTSIQREEINIEIEIIEGKEILPDTLEDDFEVTKTLNDPALISVNYVDGKQPAIRVKVRSTKISGYHVAGFYLSSKFGITNQLKTGRIKKNDNGASFTFNYEDKEYKTIPVNFDKKYLQYDITEVTDYLKMFISTKEFDLSYYEQKELELDVDSTKRSSGFDKGVIGRGAKEDWTTITIPIKVRRNREITSKVIKENEKQAIGQLEIASPIGFSAKITTASPQHVEQLFEKNKNASRGDSKLNAALLPPAFLWGNTTIGNTVFHRDTLGKADTQISILEMEDVSGDLNPERPLLIKANELTEEESILPFAYDEASEFYFPIGFTDEKGIVHIEKLPQPTAGNIFEDGAITRGTLKTSIKLFFKKLVWNPLTGDKTLNKLQLCTKNELGQVVQKLVPKDFLKNKDLGNIALLIHGIIGTSESLVNGFFKESNLFEEFDAVISFDYENLNTSIIETAEDLMEHLMEAGFFEIFEPKNRMTIIAHSMGGLVTRYMMEKASFQPYVKKIIQLGTPNGGSEIADFKKSVFGMITLGMNGLTKFKPYIAALTAVSKRLGDELFVTLHEMAPNSPFLQDLNIHKPGYSTANYYLIAGDTSLILTRHYEDDPFWRVFIKMLKQKAHYIALSYIVFKDPHNDMAVRVEQMKKSGVPAANIVILPVDHISYFTNKKVLKLLGAIIAK